MHWPWVAQRGRGGKVCALYTIVTPDGPIYRFLTGSSSVVSLWPEAESAFQEGTMLRRTVRIWRARVARRVGVPLALLGLVTGFSPLASTVTAQAGTMQNYIVLYNGSAVPANAAASIARSGGSLVYSYDQIGVAIARSDSSNFRANILKDNKVEGVSATAAFATQLKNDQARTDD